MWEAIRANRRRSVVLIAFMAVVLALLGGSIGGGLGGQDGIALGTGIAILVWAVLWTVAVVGGRGVLLGSVGAREITHDDAPMLFNIVEEMTIASGLGKMPKVFIIDTDAPNAFAVGTPQNSAVAVTSGLMMRLNRDELQGVIAHEIGHIKNQDTRFMMLAGVMMGAIILIANGFLRGMFYSGAGRRRGRGGGGGQGQALLLLLALLFAILAPLVAQLLYFACSRRREYLADASGAMFTRYPEGLASALLKISGSAQTMKKVNKAVAPMFTVNPLKAAGATGLFSTHPPTDERVRILRGMGGAGYGDYQQAFAQVNGGSVIGERTLADAQPVQARAGSAEPEKSDLGKAREAVDILHRLGGMLFLTCACGLKIKVPQGYKGKDVNCPRCSRTIPLPAAAAIAAAAPILLDEAEDQEPGTASEPGLTFQRTPGKWESFRCQCDWNINLSPSFKGDRVKCPGCGRTIRIT